MAMMKARKYIVSLAAVYTAAVCAFLCNIFFARYYGADIYGVIVTSIAFSSFAQILINWGADKKFTKELIENEGNVFVYACASIVFRAGILVLLLLIFFILEGDKGWLPIMFFLWYSLNALYPRGLADYKEKIETQNIFHSLEKVASLLVVISAYYFFGEISLAVIGVLIFLRAGFIIYQSGFLLKSEFNEVKGFWLALQSVVKGGGANLSVVIALLFNAFLIYGAQLVVKESHGYQTVAIVGLAIQLCVVVQIFQTQIVRFFNKEIFANAEVISLSYLNKKILILVAPSFFLSLLTVAGSYFLEIYILDGGYAGLGFVSITLIPWITILGGGLVVSQVFIAKIKNRYYAYISFFVFCVSLFLSLLLVPNYGAAAFSLQLFVAHGSGMAVQYYFVRKRILKEHVS